MLKEFVDVACICETFLKPNINLHTHPEFTTYRCDREERQKGGVMIIVRRNIPHKILPIIKCDLIENLRIEISSNNNKFEIVSCYVPGGAAPSDITSHFRNDIRHITRHQSRSRRQFFAMGDFNAKHRHWGCSRANRSGTLLFNEMNDGNFTINYPHEHTYHPTDTQRQSSTPDLLLTNSHLYLTELTTHPLGSDHNGVLFEANLENDLNLLSPYARPSFKDADWKTYRSVVNERLTSADVNVNHVTCPEQIDTMVETLTSTIHLAQERSVPMVVPDKYALVLPREIEEMIKVRNMVQRQSQRATSTIRKSQLKSLANLMSRQIHSSINDIRNENWSHKLRGIPTDDNHKKLWQVTKFLKNRCKKLPVLRQGANNLVTPQEKADALARQFSTAHSNPLCDDNPTHTRTINAATRRIMELPIDNTGIDTPTVSEIERYIKKLKNSKAPGFDRVHNNLLKQLPRSGLLYLTAIIIACLRLCYFPEKWKHANVIAIPKPGKKASEPSSSYRPISLLSSLSKILERTLLTRINQHISDNNNIIPHDQCGFVPGKSTVHQLYRIKNHVKQKLNNRPNISTGMLLIDVEKAFDRLWHNGLIVKLERYNFPLYIIKMVNQFLTGRTFRVTVDGKSSQPMSLPFGVPQGAVCSPILYNIYTSDAPDPSPCKRALFADDTSYYFSSRLRGSITNALRQTMLRNQIYFQQWKININLTKSQAIFFTKRRTREIPRRPLKIGSSVTPWADTSAKYLGVLLDKKLTFKEHVEYVCEKANKAIKILYPLICRRSPLNTQNKLLLYKVAIRPVFAYACPIFGDAAKCHIRRLQILQNKILRLILNMPYDTPIHVLHETADIDNISDHFNKITERFLISYNEES